MTGQDSFERWNIENVCGSKQVGVLLTRIECDTVKEFVADRECAVGEW